MKRWILLSILPLSVSAAAAAAAPEVIDLGELKVKGDIRRPSIHFYQLKSLHAKQLQELSELTFTEFEKELLNSPKKETVK
jgi:hypothetical protein